MKEWMDGCTVCRDGWIDEGMNGWMLDGCTVCSDGWIDGWMDG